MLNGSLSCQKEKEPLCDVYHCFSHCVNMAEGDLDNSEHLFVGRNEVINKLNQEYKKGIRLIQLTGLCAVGKSRTMNRFIELYLSREKLVHIDLKNEFCDFEQFRSQIVKKVSLKTNKISINCVVQLADQIIEQLHATTVIFLDNVEGMLCKGSSMKEQLLKFCRHILQESKYRILITTTTKVCFSQIKTYSYPLQQMDENTSTLLMRTALCSEELKSSEYLGCLSVICEGLPTAILMTASELEADDGMIKPHEMLEILLKCRLNALSRDNYSEEDQIYHKYKTFIDKLTPIFQGHLAKLGSGKHQKSEEEAALALGYHSTALAKHDVLITLLRGGSIVFDPKTRKFKVISILTDCLKDTENCSISADIKDQVMQMIKNMDGTAERKSFQPMSNSQEYYSSSCGMTYVHSDDSGKSGNITELLASENNVGPVSKHESPNGPNTVSDCTGRTGTINNQSATTISRLNDTEAIKCSSKSGHLCNHTSDRNSTGSALRDDHSQLVSSRPEALFFCQCGSRSEHECICTIDPNHAGHINKASMKDKNFSYLNQAHYSVDYAESGARFAKESAQNFESVENNEAIPFEFQNEPVEQYPGHTAPSENTANIPTENSYYFDLYNSTVQSSANTCLMSKSDRKCTDDSLFINLNPFSVTQPMTERTVRSDTEDMDETYVKKYNVQDPMLDDYHIKVNQTDQSAGCMLETRNKKDFTKDSDLYDQTHAKIDNGQSKSNIGRNAFLFVSNIVSNLLTGENDDISFTLEMNQPQI